MKDNKMESVELLMEQNIMRNNDIIINEYDELNKSSISSFCGNILYEYIDPLFEKSDYIEVDNERIYQNDEKKLIENMINGKIVIRDKRFIELLCILRIFKTNEERRMEWIRKVKSMNPKDILEKIDNEYVEKYELFMKNKKEKKKSENEYDIDFRKVNIPHIDVYSFLMTFQRKYCNLSIENGNLYLYYHKKYYHKKYYHMYDDKKYYHRYDDKKYDDKKGDNDKEENIGDYKIVLYDNEWKEPYGLAFDIEKRKLLLSLSHPYKSEHYFVDECNCVNQMISPFEYLYNMCKVKMGGKNNNPKKVIIDLERMYLETIFQYHDIDIFEELSKRYVNYKFEVYFNGTRKDSNGKQITYLSLSIY